MTRRCNSANTRTEARSCQHLRHHSGNDTSIKSKTTETIASPRSTASTSFKSVSRLSSTFFLSYFCSFVVLSLPLSVTAQITTDAVCMANMTFVRCYFYGGFRYISPYILIIII